MKQIQIGSTVEVRGGFNRDVTTHETTVRSMELCTMQRAKHGKSVQAIAWDEKDFGCYDLADGHWCYGEQIKRVIKNKISAFYACNL